MYQPAEDSELMVEFLPFVIRKEHSTSFLDMGCGSGIQSRAAIKAGIKEEEILAVDIDDEALEETAKLGVRTLKSDLFENVKEGEKFDLITFNPPYLPEDEHEKGMDTTGKEGWEIIARFLHQAREHLSEKGKILLLFSSLTNREKVDSLIKENGFDQIVLAVQQQFQEELYLVILEKN